MFGGRQDKSNDFRLTNEFIRFNLISKEITILSLSSSDIIDNNYVNSNIPAPREKFIMVYYRNHIIVTGGYLGSSKYSNKDIFFYNISKNSWCRKEIINEVLLKEQFDYENSGYELVGSNLYIIGGCNYSLKKCFNNTFYIDLNLMKFNYIKDSVSVLSTVEGSNLLFYDGFLFMFGGCNTFHYNSNNNRSTAMGSSSSYSKKCYNRVFIMNLNLANSCFDNCFGSSGTSSKENINNNLRNGECIRQNNKNIDSCLCREGYFGNNCEEKISICNNNCSNKGVCLVDGQCQCQIINGYEYYGNSCQYKAKTNKLIKDYNSDNNDNNIRDYLNHLNSFNSFSLNSNISNVGYNIIINDILKYSSGVDFSIGFNDIKNKTVLVYNFTNNIEKDAKEVKDDYNKIKSRENYSNDSKNSYDSDNSLFSNDITDNQNKTQIIHAYNMSYIKMKNATSVISDFTNINKTIPYKNKVVDSLVNNPMKHYSFRSSQSDSEKLDNYSNSINNTSTNHKSNCLDDCNSNGICIESTCYCKPGFVSSNCGEIINKDSSNNSNSANDTLKYPIHKFSFNFKFLIKLGLLVLVTSFTLTLLFYYFQKSKNAKKDIVIIGDD